MASRRTTYLRVVNLEKHQHYKDRRPPWIKLHAEVLDDYEFACLQDASKAHLMLLWVLASRTDNRIPNDAAWITRRIGATGVVDLESLVSAGFLEVCDAAGNPVQRDSNALAECQQTAMPETETETETETTNYPAAPSGAAGAESSTPPASAAVPPEPIRDVEPPTKRRRSARAAKSGDGTLSAFSRAACDALYERWLEKIGAVAYGRLRKELLPLWTAATYDAPDEATRIKYWRDAIGAYAAWSADDPFESRNRSLTRFAANARTFWRAAQMDGERYLAWLDSARPGLRRVS